MGSDGVVDERAAFSAATMESGRLREPLEACEVGLLCQFNPLAVDELLVGEAEPLARLLSTSRGDWFSLVGEVETELRAFIDSGCGKSRD